MPVDGRTLPNCPRERFFVLISTPPVMVFWKAIWFARLVIARVVGGKNFRPLLVDPKEGIGCIWRSESRGMVISFAFPVGFTFKTASSRAFQGIGFHAQVTREKIGPFDPDPIVHKGNRGTIPFGRIIRLVDNRLAYACYRSQGKGNPSETWIGISEDDGRSWKKRVKFGRNDSNEATLLQVGDGRVLAAVRTHVDHHVKLCESSSAGATWREKGPLTLPMQHPADLIALTDECLLSNLRYPQQGSDGDRSPDQFGWG